jgi:hypothetical protein
LVYFFMQNNIIMQKKIPVSHFLRQYLKFEGIPHPKEKNENKYDFIL